jgi:DNA-binding NtrC family response regulator
MDSPRQPLLLVVDDDAAICRILERFGRSVGYKVESHGGGRETLPRLAAIHADVALIDLQMPEVGGLDVLKAIRGIRPDCQVILMTAHATVDSAIDAVKLGALDYLSKPLPFDRLTHLLQGVRDELDRRSALLRADQETARRLELCGMIGRSAVMQELFALMRRLAPHVRVALVTGETGTGKELVARALHELGPRSRKKFVTVNCSAVVENLFESELFGHVRGAFTGATENKVGLFEAADGGTLFLDEVGELPLAVQAKLLRALEAGEVQRVGSLEPRTVDVRVIAATNRHLDEEVAAGRFRRDLLYRLNIVEIAIPPLRGRRDDIPYLMAAMVADCGERFEKQLQGVSPGAERALLAHDWPGNVRELRNVVERACMLADGPCLTDADIDIARTVHAPAATGAPLAVTNVLWEAESNEIQKALKETRGNKAAAARMLGVSRRLLYRRLEKYNARLSH